MAKYKEGHEITGRWRKGHDVQETWKFINGVWRMIWQAISSCFSHGWDNDKGWNNDEGWNND